MFYNGFNLLVDMVAVMATMFITYRYAIRKGFMLGMEAEAKANPYIDLDTHWDGIVQNYTPEVDADIFEDNCEICTLNRDGWPDKESETV
jgi:hypothetical protein